jgi:hypothetical protein
MLGNFITDFFSISSFQRLRSLSLSFSLLEKLCLVITGSLRSVMMMRHIFPVVFFVLVLRVEKLALTILEGG